MQEYRPTRELRIPPSTPPWRSLNPLLRTTEPLGVYSNGASMGDLASLRNIPASRIARVRRLTPTEEQMEFGRMHASGALVVEWAKLPR